MNKASKLCIILAMTICLFAIIAYESKTSTKEDTLNSSYEYLPPTTNISDSYLNSSEDKKEKITTIPQIPIHHTTTSYSYDYDDSYDDAVGDDYYYDDAYYDDRYADSWEYDDE